MDRPPVRRRLEIRDRVLALVVAIGLLCAVLGPAAAPAEAASLPRCRVADVITRYHARTDWARSLLDTTYRLPRSYRPIGMVSVRRAGLSGSGSIRRVALADLRTMVVASRHAGVRLAAESAYRSYASQVWTFAYWVRVGGAGAALESSARPGHSEHQLGTTIDFRSVGGGVPWRYRDWGRTREGRWLARNAWKYGFVMSYPRGKKAVTCYIYEPWHFRYVGRDVAKQVHDSGRTLRQVLWARQTAPTTPEPTPTPTATPSDEPTSTPTDEPTSTPTDEPTSTDQPAPTPTEATPTAP